MTNEQIDALIAKLTEKGQSEAFEYVNKLANDNSEYVLEKMIELLAHDDDEIVYLAARTLSKMRNNAPAYKALVNAINDKKNQNFQGALVAALSEFDSSPYFNDIFKIYLNGSFKASSLAKEILDYTEFDITPRMLRKAEKHWHHFQHNVKHDDAYLLKEEEATSILNDLRNLFEGEEMPNEDSVE